MCKLLRKRSSGLCRVCRSLMQRVPDICFERFELALHSMHLQHSSSNFMCIFTAVEMFALVFDLICARNCKFYSNLSPRIYIYI